MKIVRGELDCLKRKITYKFIDCETDEERFQVREECRILHRNIIKKYYKCFNDAQIDEVYDIIVKNLFSTIFKNE